MLKPDCKPDIVKTEPFEADVRIETSYSTAGLVLMTVDCGDVRIAAVMQPSEAADIARDLADAAQKAAQAIISN